MITAKHRFQTIIDILNEPPYDRDGLLEKRKKIIRICKQGIEKESEINSCMEPGDMKG